MKVGTGLFMAGIGFTVGLLCGLLITMPTNSMPIIAFEDSTQGRFWKLALDGSVAGRQALVQNLEQDDMHVKALKLETLSEHVELISVSHVPLLDSKSNKVTRGASNKFMGVTREHLNSVVYVNRAQQKLVLNNDSNFNDTKQFRKEPVSNDRSDDDVLKLQNVDAKEFAGADAFMNESELPNSPKGYHLSSCNDAIENVYWGDSVERYCPKGFSKDDYESWKFKVATGNFVSMNDGCGRMQNRLLTFRTSEKACARYRLNTDQMQGEIYSYYLSRLLGINNLVPSVLRLADSSSEQWHTVALDVANAKWHVEKPIILSQWIVGLSPAHIPVEFRNLTKVFRPKDVIEKIRQQGNKSDDVNDGTSLCELVQWSDLIVFDYLTANLDRVVNNLFNLQWNDRMMNKPAHNLEKGPQGNLVFLDNESGLFHGYRLLDRYSSYHEDLLNSLCVFRKQTIKSISHFVATDSIGDALHSLFEENEPLHRHLPRIPMANVKMLNVRMNNVLRQVNRCESENA